MYDFPEQLSFNILWGEGKLTGENITQVWAEFSTLSQDVLMMCVYLSTRRMPKYIVENSAQVLSCQLKFVHVFYHQCEVLPSVSNDALSPTRLAAPVPSISCCVLNHHNLFHQIQNVLAFNWDTCCRLALRLRLLPFH